MFTLAVIRKDRHTWITTQHYTVLTQRQPVSCQRDGGHHVRGSSLLKQNRVFFSHVKSVGGYTVTSQVVIHLRGRVTLGAQMNTPLGVL